MMKRLSLVLALTLSGCGITLGYPDSPGAPANDPNAPGYVIFVTNTTYTGNFGASGYTSGLSTADSICQTQSSSTSGVPSGTYRALLLDSVSRTSISQVLTGGRKYIRPDGTIIGTTLSTGAFAGSLTNSITTTGINVWTGMDANGNHTTTNCTNWTDGTNSTDTGNIGLSASTSGGAALNSQAQACTSAASLYCVEQ